MAAGRMHWAINARRFMLMTAAGLWIAGCAADGPANPRAAAPQKGFWEKLSEQMTERQCSVYRFSCPYGWGPAGEPCECTDPRGVVIKGTTVK